VTDYRPAIIDAYNTALNDLAMNLSPLADKDDVAHSMAQAIQNRSEFDDPNDELTILKHMLQWLANDIDLLIEGSETCKKVKRV
jgi:hypothetical protein